LTGISLNATPQNASSTVCYLEGKSERKEKGTVLAKILTTALDCRHFVPSCSVDAKQRREKEQFPKAIGPTNNLPGFDNLVVDGQ
jgi:hypothetical protein